MNNRAASSKQAIVQSFGITMRFLIQIVGWGSLDAEKLVKIRRQMKINQKSVAINEP